MSKRIGWWKDHPYTRKSVEDIEEFCGWQFLQKMIDECEKTPYSNHESTYYPAGSRDMLIRRDQGFLSTGFLIGGRVSEILMLRKKDFSFEKERAIVKPYLLKRYKKVDEFVEVVQKKDRPEGKEGKFYHWSKNLDGWARKRWRTVPEVKRRLPVPIPKFEPLFKYFENWYDSVDDWLFPTPKKQWDPNRPTASKGVQAIIEQKFKLYHRMWISKTRAYQIVRDVGDRLGEKLWTHWLRSQRASQLASEYGFNEWQLNRFFGWAGRQSTAAKYAHLSHEDLWRLMLPEKIKI